MKERDLELDRLLTGGHLSGQSYDDIERRVVRKVTAPQHQSRGAWFIVPAMALASVLGVWFFVKSQAEDPFRAKGQQLTEGELLSAAIDVSCDTAANRRCQPGSTLMFAVDTSAVSGYLGAFAERLDAPGAERVWYFPAADGKMPEIPSGDGTVVLPEGVLIGDRHAPGHYQLTVWLSERPVARTDFDETMAHSTLTFEVVKPGSSK